MCVQMTRNVLEFYKQYFLFYLWLSIQFPTIISQKRDKEKAEKYNVDDRKEK